MNRYGLALLSVIIISLVFNLVIALDLVPWLRGPGPWPPEWQHLYRYFGTWQKLWLPVMYFAILLLLLPCRSWASWHPVKKAAFFPILIVCGLCLQIGIMFLGTHGAQAPLYRGLLDRNRIGYIQRAVGVDNMSDFFASHTKTLPSSNQHVRTHPPGPVCYFWLFIAFGRSFPGIVASALSLMQGVGLQIGHYLHRFPPEWVFGGVIGMYGILIMSAMAVIPLYGITREFYGDEMKALYTSILLFLIPANLVGIAWFDQIFPFWVLLAFYLAVLAMKRRSATCALSSGFVSALLLFMSFGMGFMIILIIVFLVTGCLWGCLLPLRGRLKQCCVLLLPYLVALILPYVLLRVVWGYNLIENYLVGMRFHMEGLTLKRSYRTWLLFNFVDFFIFLGIPTAVLFVAAVARTLKRGFPGEAASDRFALLFTSLLLLLDISGRVRGETGRIWLFLMPFCLLIGSNGIDRNPVRMRRFYMVTYALLFLQAVVMREFWSQAF